jgi:heat-inducible transcriptional repressor
LLDKTLYLISHLTNHLSILVPPNFRSIVIKDIHLIAINPYSILIVIVTTTGLVINRIIENLSSISESDIEISSNFLKEKLEGVTVDKIDYSILEGEDKLANKHLTKALVDEIKKSLLSEMERKVLWVGTKNLLSKPEFKNVDKIKTLLDMLDNNGFIDLLNSPLDTPKDEVRITIGQEHKLKEFYDCSIITAYYKVAGEVGGNLGILGPTRMHYSKMVPLISFIAKNFSKMLSRLNY